MTTDGENSKAWNSCTWMHIIIEIILIKMGKMKERRKN